MASRVRVLVVDDSVVVRRVLSDIISSDPDLEVVGTAATAPIALQKLPQLTPDIVVLDVEMPEMDGIEAARRIRAGWPRLPILMCSTLTARGADVTLQALSAGASDYVSKPTSIGARDAGDALQAFKESLIPKLKALTTGRARELLATRPPEPTPSPPRVLSSSRSRLVTPVSVIAIGSSTGGPNALAEVFRHLPANIGVPIVVVQHMPPLFTRMLAERLTTGSAIPVKEAQDGDELLPGQGYIAPGDYHVHLVRDRHAVRVSLGQEAPENSCRPAVDVTFRSLARIYGPGVLGAVLTGMGQDGTRGARVIVEAGGIVIVQDRETSVVASMPMSVAAAGLAEASYPLHEIGGELATRAWRSRAKASLMKVAP